MAGVKRYLTINQANVKHAHIYLAECMDLFPSDVIGGTNKKEAASTTVSVDFGSGQVATDVVGEKRIFRKRSWVRQFLAENNLAAGDRVVLERLDAYAFRISAEPVVLTCLSIQQPWADLILDGKKQVENRNRPWTDAQVSLKAGNKVTLGIHVSSSLTIWRRMSAPERQHFAPGWNDEASPTGGAVAGMVDVIQICQWADLPRHLQSHQYTQKEYSWHWVFANPRRLREPVQWPGQTSLFKVNVPRRLMPAKSAASIHKVAN